MYGQILGKRSNSIRKRCILILQIAKRFEEPPKEGQKSNCMIFLGYTSNLISSGVRETIRYLAQHNMVIGKICY